MFSHAHSRGVENADYVHITSPFSRVTRRATTPLLSGNVRERSFESITGGYANVLSLGSKVRSSQVASCE